MNRQQASKALLVRGGCGPPHSLQMKPRGTVSLQEPPWGHSQRPPHTALPSQGRGLHRDGPLGPQECINSCLSGVHILPFAPVDIPTLLHHWYCIFKVGVLRWHISLAHPDLIVTHAEPLQTGFGLHAVTGWDLSVSPLHRWWVQYHREREQNVWVGRMICDSNHNMSSTSFILHESTRQLLFPASLSPIGPHDWMCLWMSGEVICTTFRPMLL